jgi:hypothetical protein
MPRDLVEFPEVGVQPQVPAPIDPVLATLIAARKLIEKPENWGQGKFESAGAYCAWGALMFGSRQLAISNPQNDGYEEAYRAIRDITPYRNLPAFNDRWNTTHADVLALFDKAIAARRSA